MKVLVISDTHRKLAKVNDLLERMIPTGVRYVIHCGDHIEDAKRIQQEFRDIKVFGVPGNCDFSSKGEERDKVIEIEGVTLFFTHGDRHHVKDDYDELLIEAKVYGAQIAICGHTHIAHMEKKDGVILLNPGSISEPRDTSRPSYAMIEIDRKRIKKIQMMQVLEDGNIAPHLYF